MEPRADDESSVERNPTRPIIALDLALALAPLIGWLSTHGAPGSQLSSGSLLAVGIGVGALFLVAEWFPIDVELGEQGHTVAFTAVPLVVGLAFLPPLVVVGVRVGASLIVLGLIGRQGALKLGTNVLFHATQAAVAAAVFVPFVDGVPSSPRTWLIAGAAVLAAEAAGIVLVTTAISLSEGRFDAAYLDGILAGWAVLLPDAALGLLTAILLHQAPAAVVLTAIVGVALAAVVRSYARVTERYRVLEVLDSFTAALVRAVVDDRLHDELLSQLAERLHARSAWIQRPEALDRRLVRRDGHLIDEPLPGDLRPGDERDHRIIGSVRAGTALLLIGVDDRLGDVRAFDREDHRLFELLVAHASVALQNVGLLDRVRHEAAMSDLLATTDQLTGLPNRTRFLRDLDRAGTSGAVAVLVVGVDRFKEVNDTLGHQHGGELLCTVADQLDAHLRAASRSAPVTAIARLGGDQFAVRWDGITAEQAMARSRSLVAALSGGRRIAGVELDVALSGGLAWADSGGIDGIRLLRQADVAMHLAKADRRPVVAYEPDRDTANPARLAMAGRLRAAIEEGALTLHYQPQLDLRSDRVVGVEALVRWMPPDQQRPISPADFVDVAERTGLIHPLTRLVLQRAAAQAAAWQRQGLDLRMSVNLSARNLEDESLGRDLAAILAGEGVDPRTFEVQVTETSVMTDPTTAIATLQAIAQLGVSVSIDDFGTGHSSLAYLIRLPVHQLKVDRSFVMAMDRSDAGRAVVHAIVDLGRHLGLEVVAEGIETQAQLDLLAEVGCATGQGYLFARPLPATELVDWIERHHAAQAPSASIAAVVPIPRGAAG